MTDERIAFLEGLQTQPGWLLFKEHARKEWGPEGYGRKVKLAIMAAKDDGSDVIAAVKAVDYASEQFNALISWPADTLKHLTDARERDGRGQVLSRRGAGL